MESIKTFIAGSIALGIALLMYGLGTIALMLIVVTVLIVAARIILERRMR